MVKPKEWINFWFDVKTNACGYFETEGMLRATRAVVHTLAYIGGGTSMAAGALDVVLNRVVPSGSQFAARWVEFIKESAVLRRLFPYVVLASAVSAGVAVACQFDAQIAEHRRAGIEYNILARRVERAIRKPDAEANEAEWLAVNDARDNIERNFAMHSVSDRVQAVARGIVLAKAVRTLAPPMYLKYACSLEKLKRENEINKRALLSKELKDW